MPGPIDAYAGLDPSTIRQTLPNWQMSPQEYEQQRQKNAILAQQQLRQGATPAQPIAQNPELAQRLAAANPGQVPMAQGGGQLPETFNQKIINGPNQTVTPFNYAGAGNYTPSGQATTEVRGGGAPPIESVWTPGGYQFGEIGKNPYSLSAPMAPGSASASGGLATPEHQMAVLHQLFTTPQGSDIGPGGPGFEARAMMAQEYGKAQDRQMQIQAAKMQRDQGIIQHVQDEAKQIYGDALMRARADKSLKTDEEREAFARKEEQAYTSKRFEELGITPKGTPTTTNPNQPATTPPPSTTPNAGGPTTPTPPPTTSVSPAAVAKQPAKGVVAGDVLTQLLSGVTTAPDLLKQYGALESNLQNSPESLQKFLATAADSFGGPRGLQAALENEMAKNLYSTGKMGIDEYSLAESPAAPQWLQSFAGRFPNPLGQPTRKLIGPDVQPGVSSGFQFYGPGQSPTYKWSQTAPQQAGVDLQRMVNMLRALRAQRGQPQQ